MDIRVDDYVLCVGRLCFTDVDPTVEKLFKSLPMAFHSCSSSGSAHAGNVDATPSEATSLRISGSAKASSSEAATDVHNEPGGRSRFRASSDVYEDSIGDPMCLQPISSENQSIRDATHVLLPGAPSPIAVTDLLELGISLDNVPSGTRFFSAAESIDRSQLQAMQFGLHQECDSNDLVTRHSHCVRAAAPREVMCPTPPRFCVKGKVRLISSSNEILFWCLSAIDTHVRLKSIALQRAVSYS
ncbi:unnamed protein product [Phytomonas sp. EM1]|nr:unnamed protein product [Phytomonas sp. EM1]|eukprot:CCW63664.1 unnamed protein product [Phytomonas sp. isolate EM1]